jgi:hypothetical protein
MLKFDEIYRRLPNLLNELINVPSYPIRDLTEGALKRLLGDNSQPIAGVFLITDHTKNRAIFVGRSRNMAQRIGVDLRATTKEQATISYKLTTLKNEYPELETIRGAREFMYKNYSVQMIKVADENERAILQIYAAMELGTTGVFNSFRET